MTAYILLQDPLDSICLCRARGTVTLRMLFVGNERNSSFMAVPYC